jgi:dTDP-4-amino-4,6-dideoxygalactose transaminase
MPAFAAFAAEGFPVTDDFAGRAVGLPVYPGIDAAALARIAAALAAAACMGAS